MIASMLEREDTARPHDEEIRAQFAIRWRLIAMEAEEREMERAMKAFEEDADQAKRYIEAEWRRSTGDPNPSVPRHGRLTERKHDAAHRGVAEKTPRCSTRSVAVPVVAGESRSYFPLGGRGRRGVGPSRAHSESLARLRWHDRHAAIWASRRCIFALTGIGDFPHWGRRVIRMLSGRNRRTRKLRKKVT